MRAEGNSILGNRARVKPHGQRERGKLSRWMISIDSMAFGRIDMGFRFHELRWNEE